MSQPTRFAGILRTAAMKRVKEKLANEDRRLLRLLEYELETKAIVDEPEERGGLFLVKR